MVSTATKPIYLLLTIIGLLIISTGVNAYEQGDWLVRARIINVDPNDDSNSVTGLAGSEVSVDDDTTLELDVTYMLSPNIGLELIAATSKHDVQGEGSISGLGKILSARTVPPTLTLQYHFMPNNKIQPYAGIGLNYTFFYDEDSTKSLDGALGSTNVELDNSFGLAAQVGVDFAINDVWFINADIKYIDMDTEATLKSAGVKRDVDVDIDPWLWGIGIGRSF